MKRNIQLLKSYLLSCRINGFLLTTNSYLCTWLYRLTGNENILAAYAENQEMILAYYARKRGWGL